MLIDDFSTLKGIMVVKERLCFIDNFVGVYFLQDTIMPQIKRKRLDQSAEQNWIEERHYYLFSIFFPNTDRLKEYEKMFVH